MNKKTGKDTKKSRTEPFNETPPIVFDGEMRRAFVENVLKHAKAYFEGKTSGAVQFAYEDFPLKNHEFGFKLLLSHSNECTKQMFNEVTSALINVINYMFPADSDEYDLSFCTSRDKVEVELVSNW